MGSDIARRTYDAGRQYRRVIAQQGRAVIEADLNEAQEITTEEIRKEALDIVGPAGTPDDGYKITFAEPEEGAPVDVHIGPGTMYVGGMRVELPAPGVFYTKQHEWLDGLPPAPSSSYEHVCLHLIEREVSAVEDRPLREVALGGPDTAQRTRLLQRFRRFESPTARPSCEEAFAHVQEEFEEEGLYFNPETMRLESKATLLAAFVPPSPPPDPCSPAAQAGYLGAENQLIRVQIAGPDKLLWGYDNASFLYRVTEVDVDVATNKTVLKLASSPVDAHHQPRIDQCVEVLVAGADLDDGNYVAALSGQTALVTAQYNPVDRTIEIGLAIPTGYADAIAESALFVRVWEEQLDIDPGVATPLGDTGLQVTLSAPGNLFATGEYWMIAVRPGAPTRVFPERYEQGPQPPDGPRQWLCPLGVVHLTDGGFSLFHDCRRHFDNLVELSRRRSGCCTVTVAPEDVGGGAGLQALIDSLSFPATICLLPGTYTLDAPLRLDHTHAGLTIESCFKEGAVIKASSTSSSSFVDGLVVLVDATAVTLRGLRFELRQQLFDGNFGFFTPASLFLASAGEIDLRRFWVAVGVRVVASQGGECRDITIRECTFRQATPPDREPEDYTFSAYIFLAGKVVMLDVHDNDLRSYSTGSNQAFHYGCLHVPATAITEYDPSNEVADASAHSLLAILDEAVFRGNTFRTLTAAILLNGDNRKIRVETNDIAGCGTGVALLSTDAWHVTNDTLEEQIDIITPLVDEGGNTSAAVTRLQNLRDDDSLTAGGAIARAYPLPSGIALPPPVVVPGSLALSSLATMLIDAEESTFGGPFAWLVQGKLVLHVHGNDIESTGDAGTSLLVWAPSTLLPAAEVVIGMNRMTSNTRTATALLYQVGQSTVQGNHFVNEHSSISNFCLAILPIYASQRRAAITGNVFRTLTLLPKRVGPVTAGTLWLFFNHEEPLPV